ncbi:MAG: hypothetical protein LBP59_11070 [Planctomycetaceae bacterium]|jgi:hypothetical protein|nr:hypothetical protein [Planctomycetaceae bacterium]
MNTFMIIEGEHQGAQRKFKKGDIFQSEYPLDTMFVGKFTRVSKSEEVPVDVPKGKSVGNRLTFVFADAQDVTNSFPSAIEHHLKVYKDATGGYAVTSEIVKGIEPLNLAPSILGSKTSVTKWLNTYIESLKSEQ